MIDIDVPEWWLTQANFTRGNPFRVKEADAEPFLEPCFREKTYFYDLRGDVETPRTAFLAAERGSGKSANRRMLAQQCMEGRLGGLVLAVPYLDFALLIEKGMQGAGEVTTRMHVNEILKHALPALLNLLRKHPAHLEKLLYAEGYRKQLKWFLDQYTEILTKEGMDSWLRQADLLSRDINAQKIFQAASEGDALLADMAFEDEIVFLLVQMLNQESASLNAEDVSHVALFKRFVDLIEFLDIKALYILIDRVDESPAVAANPEVGARLLEPLVADLHLMDMQHVAFKFFLPSDIADALKQSQAARIDRLIFREISWSIEDLVDILNQRIHVYSAGIIPNLEQLSAPQLSQISGDLAAQANGSPRNLLRLGEWLLHHHVRMGKGNRSISQKDVKAALESFHQEQMQQSNLDNVHNVPSVSIRRAEDEPIDTEPIETVETPSALAIDERGVVWRGGEALGINLSELEYRLLACFLANPDILLTKDNLIEAVYGEEAAFGGSSRDDDRSLYALIGRLRNKIEPDPRNPQYIVNVFPRGYRFDSQTST